MNKPTYRITGVSQELGIGNNKTVSFMIYDSHPPMVGWNYYSRPLDCGVYVTKVEKL